MDGVRSCCELWHAEREPDWSWREAAPDAMHIGHPEVVAIYQRAGIEPPPTTGEMRTGRIVSTYSKFTSDRRTPMYCSGSINKHGFNDHGKGWKAPPHTIGHDYEGPTFNELLTRFAREDGEVSPGWIRDELPPVPPTRSKADAVTVLRWLATESEAEAARDEVHGRQTPWRDYVPRFGFNHWHDDLREGLSVVRVYDPTGDYSTAGITDGLAASRALSDWSNRLEAMPGAAIRRHYRRLVRMGLVPAIP